MCIKNHVTGSFCVWSILNSKGQFNIYTGIRHNHSVHTNKNLKDDWLIRRKRRHGRVGKKNCNAVFVTH